MRLAIPNRDELGESQRFALDYLVARLVKVFSVAHDDAGRITRPVLIATHNTTQSHTSSGNWQAVQFNTEPDLRGVVGVSALPSGVHDRGVRSDRFIIPASLAGMVRMSVTVVFAANATGSRGVYLDINGVQVPGSTLFVPAATAVGPTYLQSHWLGPVSAADVVTVYAYQNSGGALNLGSTAAAAQNRLVIEFL